MLHKALISPKLVLKKGSQFCLTFLNLSFSVVLIASVDSEIQCNYLLNVPDLNVIAILFSLPPVSPHATYLGQTKSASIASAAASGLEAENLCRKINSGFPEGQHVHDTRMFPFHGHCSPTFSFTALPSVLLSSAAD